MEGYKRDKAKYVGVIDVYEMKYIFGQTVIHNGNTHRIMAIRFTENGIMYKLSGINEWIKEEEV